MQTAAGSSPARGSAFFKISRDGRDGLRCRFDSGERWECDRAAPPHVLWRESDRKCWDSSSEDASLGLSGRKPRDRLYTKCGAGGYGNRRDDGIDRDRRDRPADDRATRAGERVRAPRSSIWDAMALSGLTPENRAIPGARHPPKTSARSAREQSPASGFPRGRKASTRGAEGMRREHTPSKNSRTPVWASGPVVRLYALLVAAPYTSRTAGEPTISTTNKGE